MRSDVYRKFGAVLTAIGIFLCFIAGTFQLTAHAEDFEDGSIQLICSQDEQILGGMQWNLFYVGSRNGDDITISDSFKDYKISFEDTSADSMSDLASTLENYVILDNIPPEQSGMTDERGVVGFTGLKQGLYFMCGDLLKIGHTSYVPVPFMFEISQEEDGTNQNYVTYPKFFHFSVLDQRDVDYTIKKVWRNSNNQPPDEDTYITVEMYKNGEYQQTITLDESNDWTYTWTDKAHTDWRVKEVDIPEGYDVIYRSNETQFVIVNTYKDYRNPPTETTTETQTTTTGIAEGTEYTNTTTISAKETDSTVKSDILPAPPNGGNGGGSGGGGKLPQTGQLWWPVPVLSVLGILFISIGLRIRSKESKATA